MPPPPPPPPAPLKLVRIGGQLQPPALVKRVEPLYPDLAAAAKITGIVILEAEVGIDGCVSAVRVLRPVHKLLDAAAIDALKQWQYSPLVLNGIATLPCASIAISPPVPPSAAARASAASAASFTGTFVFSMKADTS